MDATGTAVRETQFRGCSQVLLYNEVRTHLSLEKDAPIPRATGTVGHILCHPILGGLHQQYVRI